ncbi:MAG: manganese-dependent inorganic pyrophosphatase [Patescibacteria group bacterium]|jgi:manganese-dependent inorganic pyrophosphatase|nr:manganese-dependent inorganic pyrophosphatase [Patescibacteria group bacterium]
MTKVFGHLNPDTDSVTSAVAYAWFLSEHCGVEAEPYVLSRPNKEAVYALSHFGVEMPETLGALEEGAEVVIVDTNNPTELPADLGNALIKEVVDHHKLGGITTPEPLAVTIRPVACTATVILGLMKQKGIEEAPSHIAGLMLSAILSDTLMFTSPTTTEEDRQAAEQLAKMAGTDMEELASALFTAKSDLTGMSARDILLADSKLFTMGDKKIRVSSLETTDTKPALAMEAELLAGIEELKNEEFLDGMFFFVVDILSSNSTLILASSFEKETASKAFELTPDGSQLFLPGVVSRKKQMVPPLERALS